nr:FAD-dependent oxidoreductase [Clostridia bacterium]
WAISDKCDDDYTSTLRRFEVKHDDMRRFHYEPDAMADAMNELMHEADSENNLILLYDSELVGLETDGRAVVSCTVKTPDGEVVIYPKFVIDCTADIAAARMAGCRCEIGDDEGNPVINGITQSFIITKSDDAENTIPDEYSDVCLDEWEEYMAARRAPVSVFYIYPCGDIGVNMLPTIDGSNMLEYSYDELKHICEARVYSYMRFLAENYGLTGYRVRHMFIQLGLRESYRLVGKYVLTIDDLVAGHPKDIPESHIIALADHPADTHGSAGGRCIETGRYGIPYECLLPLEYDNMLVACRGASFSHRAASSARLSRTMIQLGEAAGSAAALCVKQGIKNSDINRICTDLRRYGMEGSD